MQGWEIVMAVQNGDRQDLQSLASLLADIESRLAEETDQSQLFCLRQTQQRCLLEIYLLKRTLQRKDNPR